MAHELRFTEDQLSGAFANRLTSSPAFNQWLLGRTKFRSVLPDARLMHTEQSASRSAMHWWRHWWCTVPGLGESETDIMAIYERSNKKRFALHIENKLRNSRWSSKHQAQAYHARATFMMGQPRFMNYDDFATIIIAPYIFLDRWKTEVSKFDTLIPYECIVQFVPEFKEIRFS